MRVREIYWLWLPLAVSFELMMLEGPVVQGAMGWLPNAKVNLAAWGLTMSLSLLVESPVIMLLATAIALVKSADTYRALRQFTVSLAVGCTLLTALVAFTPLFTLVAGRWMGQPDAIMAAAQPAMQIMLLWTAAIAWRRFYQGVLVKYGQTRMVSWGTAIRLAAALITAVLLARQGQMPGVQVGALAIMAAVLTEAVATTLFALPVVRDQITHSAEAEVPEEPLTQKQIFRFHAPLAATTVLTLLAHPMTSAALARLSESKATLAAWPVVFMVLLILRGGGLALQEISVAQSRNPQSRPALRRFTWLVGGITTAAGLLLVTTPLLDLYLNQVIHLPADLRSYTRIGVGACLLLPLITALGSWARGLLVASGATSKVYRGMGVNLAMHSGLLLLGVLLHLPGMWVAAGAFTLASVAEYAYLIDAARHLSGSIRK